MIKKIIAGIIISCSLLLFLFFGALSLVNYNSVASNFTSRLGIANENIGKIKINKFPIPYLAIESIKEDGKVDLEEVKVYFSFWSLIKFSPQISKLEILDAKIYADSKMLNIYNNEELIDKFFKYKLQNINLNITNLNIINKQDYSILNFSNCSLKKEHLSSNYIFKTTSNELGTISGSINKSENIVNFSFDIDNKDYNFKLSQVYKDSKLDSGNGEYNIKNLALAMYNILPDLSHILNKLNQTDVVNVKFNILNSEDAVELKDIVVESPFITGGGAINIAKNDTTTGTVNLNFSKIDLNSIVSSNAPVTFNTAPSNIRFIFADKLLKINIVIDEVILSNNNTLEKVTFTSSLSKGTLKIDECLGSIKPDGEFKLLGNVTQNSIRSMFDGQIYLKHNDFNSLLNILGFADITVKDSIPFTLSSELKLTLIDLFFKDLSLKTDNLSLSGNFSGKFIAQTPHLNATLSISSLDLTKNSYPVISPFIEFVQGLTKDMKSLDYPSKFIPIRTNPYTINLDILVDGVKYNDQIFDKMNLLAKISPANIKISNLDFKTNNSYLSTSWNLDASSVLPSLTVEIKDGSLNTDLLSPAKLLDLRNKLVNDYSLDKVTLQIYGNLSSLSQNENDLVLKNIKFYAVNNNNLLQFNNIEADLLGGKLQGSGNILLDPYSLNFVYALNTIDLDKASALLPKIFAASEGEISISGSFSTNGNTLQNQLYNLTSKLQFAINVITVNNFNIDSFIQKINNYDYNASNLDKDINSAITTGQQRITGVSGNIDLQKGIALLKDINFVTQYSTGAASFAVNIYNFDMDSSNVLSFYIPSSLVKSDTKNTSSNADKSVLSNLSLRVQGNMSAPKKTFDSSELKKLLISPTTTEATDLVNH